MNETESRAWAAHLDATLPPPVPAGDRLYEHVRLAALALRELEIALDARPDLVEFGREVVDAVSMVGRLTDQLDYERDQAEEEADDEEEDRGWAPGAR